MDFQADSVQGVIFVAQGQQQGDAQDIWEQVFAGDRPDGYQRPLASPTLTSNANGLRGGYNVNIIAQVGRIDITLATQIDPASNLNGPPRIADIQAAVKFVANLLQTISAKANPVRVAIVLDMAITVSHGTDSTKLREILGKFPLPENSTDIALQFNSRKVLDRPDGAALNRMCLWNSGQMGFLQSNNPHGALGGGIMMMSSFVGMKVDVNTLQEFRVTAENVSGLIEEISKEVIAIGEEGLGRFGI